MKKLGRILCLATLIVTLTASICFGAEGLQIVEAYPEDGQKNTTIENMCVKLWFNHEMGDKESVKANKDCFKLTDDEGKEIPIRVFYHPDDTKQVLVLADTTKKLDIKDNTEYTMTVSADLIDNDGHKLGQDAKYTFTTLNQGRNNAIYMVMMFVMFGGMFFFTSRQMKKQQEGEQKERQVKEEAFNPYKEAKRTGKSVQEVIAAHEKEQAKKAAKQAKKAAKNAVDEDEYEEIEDNGNYRVKGPRPISASGSTFITGRKAEAEARKAEEERLARRRAANAKGKKKK
ncbi:MAG: Ig-like domain-containing protein [Firmicutes bacterium]|nr:Ig-like domain-containing protein [Bacillota bacterium]